MYEFDKDGVVVGICTQSDWEEVLNDSQRRFGTPDMAAMILAGLYRHYSAEWPGRGAGRNGADAPEYKARAQSFVRAAQKVLGVKVVANNDGVWLQAGKCGWPLAHSWIANAPQSKAIANRKRGCHQSSGKPFPETELLTMANVSLW